MHVDVVKDNSDEYCRHDQMSWAHHPVCAYLDQYCCSEPNRKHRHGLCRKKQWISRPTKLELIAHCIEDYYAHITKAYSDIDVGHPHVELRLLVETSRIENFALFLKHAACLNQFKDDLRWEREEHGTEIYSMH